MSARRASRTTSLALRVLLALTGVVSLTMLLAQGLTLRSAYEERGRLLDDRARQIAAIAAEGIARPLFDFNTPVVEAATAALSQDPDFVGAAVFDTDGKRVALSGQMSSQDEGIVVQRDLRFDNNGSLTPV